MSRMSKGYFISYRDHVLDHGDHPAFSKKPKTKFVFYILKAMATFKKTYSVGVGEIRTSYDEIADETGFTRDEVRWCITCLIKHKMLVKKSTHQGLHLSIPRDSSLSEITPGSTTAESQGQHQGQHQGANAANDNNNISIDAVVDRLVPALTPGLTTLVTSLVHQGSPTVKNKELRSNSNNEPSNRGQLEEEKKYSVDTPSVNQSQPQDSQLYNDPKNESYPQSQQDISTPFDEPIDRQTEGNYNVDNYYFSDRVRDLLSNSGIKEPQELKVISDSAQALKIEDAQLSIIANEMYGKYKNKEVRTPFRYYLKCLRNFYDTKPKDEPKPKPVEKEAEAEVDLNKKNQEFTDLCWQDRAEGRPFSSFFDFSRDGYPSDYEQSPEKYKEVTQDELENTIRK